MTANPQIENGHTDIANEILDHLCSFRIPGECRCVFDAIMRKTWGWHKKEDFVAGSQIVELTGMKKGNVSRSLSKLITSKLVIKTDNKLKINKNYIEWIPFGVIKTDNKQKLSKVITKVIKSDNKKLSEVRDTKEKKETIQKKEQKLSADSFFNSFKEIDNKRTIAKANKYDIRTKDVVYCANQANEWANGKQKEKNTWIWWDSFFNRWINRAIRHHELATLSGKEEKKVKDTRSKAQREEDEWICKNVTIIQTK